MLGNVLPRTCSNQRSSGGKKREGVPCVASQPSHWIEKETLWLTGFFLDFFPSVPVQDSASKTKRGRLSALRRSCLDGRRAGENRGLHRVGFNVSKHSRTRLSEKRANACKGFPTLRARLVLRRFFTIAAV